MDPLLECRLVECRRILREQDLAGFKRQWPFHNDLDLIDKHGRQGKHVLIGNGRFEIPGPRAGQLAKLKYVDIIEGPYGKELELTAKGEKSLDNSREAFAEL